MFVGFALNEVLLPAHVVDIDHVSVCIDVENFIDDGLDQIDIVRDDDEAACIVGEVLAQPDDGICIKVVSWLIEQERLGARE